MSVFTTVLLTVGGIVVGVVVTILVARKYRSRKELSSYLVRYESTLMVTDWMKDSVTIKYDHKEVENLQRFHLILQNTGNKAIKDSDIVKPIEILFEEPAQIVTIRKEVSNFKEYSICPPSINRVRIDFKLMNPKDIIGIEVITTEANPNLISITGRGAELKICEIKNLTSIGKKNRGYTWRWMLTTGIWMLIALVGPIIGILLDLDMSVLGKVIPIVISVLYLCVVVAVLFILTRIFFPENYKMTKLRHYFEDR